MDHVHYDDSARQLQAAFIAGNLKQIIVDAKHRQAYMGQKMEAGQGVMKGQYRMGT